MPEDDIKRGKSAGLIWLLVAFSIMSMIRSQANCFVPPTTLSEQAVSEASSNTTRENTVPITAATHASDIPQPPSVAESDATSTTKTTPSGFLNPSPVCESLAHVSAMSLWVQHIDDILAASRLGGDENYKNHDITAQVLRLVTPRLPLSQRSSSRDSEAIDSVMKKAFARYQYLQSPTDGVKEPHPVQIVVLGGSVAMGINCNPGIRWWDGQKCSWANRLESMVNTLAGGTLIKIHNMAVGGTNTKQGQAMIQYELLPSEAKNHDVLINAYSTNDMHILTMKQAEGGNMTLRETVFDMAQDFARVALDPCTEKRPLLLWLDDYLGNEQRGVLQTTELSQGIQVLSNYYGFGFFSYADVVRDWVYGDTQEATFSPAGWYNTKNSDNMQREIHPGQTMHMSTAWVMAYNLLQLAATHCSLEAWNHIEHEKTMQYNLTSPPPGLPLLKETVPLKGPPRPRASGLPPLLTPDLQLDDISDQWKDQKDASGNPKTCPESEAADENGEVAPRCSFSWVSGIDSLPTIQTADDVRKHFSNVLVEPNNWELVDKTGRGTKYGWTPLKDSHSAVMNMEFDALEHPVQTIAFFFLKSYGPKWEGSTATVDLQVKDAADPKSSWKSVETHTMTGFHDKKTSEMYNEEVHLPAPTKSLRLSLRLTQGTTFKLMGMAVCR